MPSSPAHATIYISEYVAKEEGAYGGGGSLSASTDAIELWLENKQAALGSPGYNYDGSMGPQLAGLGQRQRVPPAGKFIKAALPLFFRGPGVAYSSSEKNSLHTILKACGMDATGSFGGGAEKWTFTPTAEGSAITSLVDLLLHRGEEWKRDGVIGNLKIDAPDAKPPKFTFDSVGRGNADPVARAIGALTYGFQSVSIPLACPAALVFGSYASAVVQSWSFDMGRSYENFRPDLNAAGYHAGYQPGVRNPIVVATIEQTALVGTPFHASGGINPQKLREAATAIAFSAQIGTAQYNRLKLSCPTVQLVGEPGYTEVNGVACLQLTFEAKVSAPGANDDFSIVTD